MMSLFWRGTADPTALGLTLFLVPLTVLFCCRAGCCRMPFCLCLLLGTGIMLLACHLLLGEVLHLTPGGSNYPRVDGTHDSSKRIAVIGGGPSGVFAAWALALDGDAAQVDLYEANARFGGHSDTVVIDGKPLDIGFIFSNNHYILYNALADRHNVSRMHATIPVHFHGDAHGHAPWNNMHHGASDFAAVAGDARAAKLAAEIARFSELVNDMMDENGELDASLSVSVCREQTICLHHCYDA